MNNSIRTEDQQLNSAAADIHVVLAGYRLLRLDPAQWRAAAAKLALPLVRLGRMKRVQSEAWQAAIVDSDCVSNADADCGGELCA